MKVSIVIPVYNASKYIDECIQSALDQTYNDIEIIAVDDGSTDDSLPKLKKYSEKVKVLTKENGGTPTALNVGIKVMSGEWFKWLSADDVLEKNAIEILINEIKILGEESKSCILYSNYELIDEKSKIVGEFIEPNLNNLTNFERNVILLDNFFGNGTTSLIHKSIFDRFGLFDEKIRFQEDYEFWLRCSILNDCRLFLIPKKLARYRLHEEQLTQKRFSKTSLHAQSVRDLIISRLTEDERSRYLNALRIYKNQKPLKVRIRRLMIDTMIKILPEQISGFIIQSYLKIKTTK